MRDAFEVMARIRETPDLSARVVLFAGFLEAEFGYDGFTYGICIDASSLENMFASHILKMRIRHSEWLQQYSDDQLGKRDLAVVHGFLGEGLLLQSRVFRAVDDGRVPDLYCEVPNRARDYYKSGFFLPLRSGGLVCGVGLHSSSMTPERHDEQFARAGHLIVELCRQFHDMASWRDEIAAATGLSAKNLQVLQLRSQGLLDKQIIEITGHRHENSVRQHIERVRKALRTKTEREMLIRAASLGLTAVPEFPDRKLSEIETTARLTAEREGWLRDMV